jgi:hypothetical protein
MNTWEANYEEKLGELLRERATSMSTLPRDLHENFCRDLGENVIHAIEWRLSNLVVFDTEQRIGEEMLAALDSDEDWIDKPSKVLSYIESRLDVWIHGYLRSRSSVDFRGAAEAVKAETALRIRERAFRDAVSDARYHADEMASPTTSAELNSINRKHQELKEHKKKLRSPKSIAAIDADLAACEVERDRVLTQRRREIDLAKNYVLAEVA